MYEFNDDNWVETAMVDDSIVATFLLTLNKKTSSSSSTLYPPFNVHRTVRQRRSNSRTHTAKIKAESRRASPTTPLSWSAATSGSGAAATTTDGNEVSSRFNKSLHTSRSKIIRYFKLTYHNHEEECQRLELLAAINESIRTSLEAAKKLAEEEARYARITVDAEQARIAAEIEHKRFADQEAFKVLVERAVHIAEIETHKINESQTMDEDHIMLDQIPDESADDKGKAALVDFTPPGSPPRFVQGSPSSAIPPAIQLALDNMKNDLREELKNEMDEFRADMREDLNRSGEATHKKIDAMMELLLKFVSQLPKP